MRIPHPDPMVEAEQQMAARVAECIFGGGPDARVRDLRRSILGSDAVPDDRLLGLSAALDRGDE